MPSPSVSKLSRNAIICSELNDTPRDTKPLANSETSTEFEASTSNSANNRSTHASHPSSSLLTAAITLPHALSSDSLSSVVASNTSIDVLRCDGLGARLFIRCRCFTAIVNSSREIVPLPSSSMSSRSRSTCSSLKYTPSESSPDANSDTSISPSSSASNLLKNASTRSFHPMGLSAFKISKTFAQVEVRNSSSLPPSSAASMRN